MLSIIPYRKIFILVVAFLTLFSYISLRIPPHIFWPAAFLSYSVPFFVALSSILLALALFQKRLTAFLWFILLILGVPYLLRTIQLNHSATTEGATQVLSFNAKLFRQPHVYNQFSIELIDWVAADTSAIKCIQEYSTNAMWAPLDVTGKLKAHGFEGFTFVAEIDDRQHNPGLAIFSKYKIVNTGVVWHDPQSLNAAIYADLQKGEKTIRVYNVHLASMQLIERPAGWIDKTLFLLERLKKGSIKRSQQINLLAQHINTSPYPVLICGDFNETPYSYVYSTMRRKLTNAFEKRGHGFGFTLNQKPYFLRIDHQFYSDEFKLQKYTVDRTMKISDHFPTYGYYLLP
ncbi:MAG: endonuclease/exonuclease/phosphatase family protein [Cyclobacteriaceae bacterium]|nr:endonuclease/exonuclease/phosphatase family protein [Cyclobacteriaceae bacterium]